MSGVSWVVATLTARECSMLVIHGIWAYGALHVWAEDSALPAQAPPRAGRPSRAPRPHPFAVAADALCDALSDTCPEVAELSRKAVDDELTLRLPTVVDGPQASPELARPVTVPAAQAGKTGRAAPPDDLGEPGEPGQAAPHDEAGEPGQAARPHRATRRVRHQIPRPSVVCHSPPGGFPRSSSRPPTRPRCCPRSPS
jgi:hypothetical protein